MSNGRVFVRVRRLSGLDDNFRVADHTEVIGSDHAKRLFLLEICRIKRDCSYLPTGTFRRSWSEKFIRKVTWLCVFCPSAVSTGIIAAMRLLQCNRQQLAISEERGSVG